MTEERDAGNFGRETTLRFGFFACFRIPEFVETVDSRRGKNRGVRTPRKRENMIIVAFESFFERRGVSWWILIVRSVEAEASWFPSGE